MMSKSEDHYEREEIKKPTRDTITWAPPLGLRCRRDHLHAKQQFSALRLLGGAGCGAGGADSVVLLGDFSTQEDNDRETWRSV